MITFPSLLDVIYRIQGASDPNDSPQTLKERMDEIYELASRVMKESGYEPD
jgi:transcriptional regulator of met regulon